MGFRKTADVVGRVSRRAVSIWASRLGGTVAGAARPSMIANWALTSKCTFLCRSCAIGRNHLEQPGAADTDLTESELLAILDRDADALKYVTWIQFTGGEPFLRGDLARIVTAFSDRLPNCAFWLPTNGWSPETVEATVRRLLQAGVSRLGVGVSLHGDEERHDAYAGRPGSRARAVETLSRLTTLREDHPSLRVGAGFTITPDNLTCLVPACDTARSMGADFTCRLANPSDTYFGYSAPGDYSPEFLRELDGRLAILERKMGFARPSLSPTLLSRWRYYRGIRGYAADPARVQLACRAGKTSVFITAKGIVYPCLFVPTPMGDLREQGLRHILNSPENRKLQKAICVGDCPNCWVECETYRVLYENAFRVVASGTWEAFRSRLSRRPSGRRSGVAPGAGRASSAT